MCRIGWVRWLSGGIAGVGVPVVRALRASSILVSVITVVAGVLMVVGLALSARPEIAGGLGFALTSRDGLALALGSGAVAIASALLGRVLALLAVSE